MPAAQSLDFSTKQPHHQYTLSYNFWCEGSKLWQSAEADNQRAIFSINETKPNKINLSVKTP